MKSTSEKYRENFIKYSQVNQYYSSILFIIGFYVIFIFSVYMITESSNILSILYFLLAIYSSFSLIDSIAWSIEHSDRMWLLENDYGQYEKLYGDKNDI